MDPFIHLNFSYPGMHDSTRLRGPHSPEGPLHHSPINPPAAPPNQAHPGNAHLRLGSSKTTRTRTILDRTTSHNARHQRQRSLQTACPPNPSRLDYTDLLANLYCMDESSDSSDRYIPSSSDKLTCSDHRPLDQIFGKLHVSPVGSQVKATPILSFQAESARLRPSNVSVLTYTLPSKPQLDGVLQIPLLAVNNQMSGTGVVIAFQCSDWGIGVPVEGIPMTDLLRGDYSALEHAHERVLDGLGLVDLRLNIFWPDYSPFAKKISAFGSDGKPLTRAGLGYEVALAFAEFYYVTSQTVQPTQHGPYTIASSRPGSTSPGIRFDDLRLIAVRNTSLGEWMAEVKAILSC